MKRSIFNLLFVVAFLFACSAEETEETAAKKDPIIKEEEEIIPTSEEEWRLTLADSDWYGEIKEANEILFERFLDFNGDGIQELIVGTNSSESQVAMLHIGEYKLETKEWSNLHTESYDYFTYMEPRLYGVLDNGRGTQVAAISIFEAGASAAHEEFRILKNRESHTQSRIIDGFTYESSSSLPNLYSVDEETQKIIINGEYTSETYTLTNNILTTEEGYKKRLYTGAPITTNKEFIRLLDNSYFESGTYFGDGSEIAKLNDTNLIGEGSVEGGYGLQFEDYEVYYGKDDMIINTIELNGFDHLLISEIEKVIGEKIKKESFYSELDGETKNVGEFMFDGYQYHAELTSVSEDAVVNSLIIYNDLHN